VAISPEKLLVNDDNEEGSDDMSVGALLDQVLTLQVDERAMLAQRIWDSIEHFVSRDVEQAWLEEAERRWQEIEEGRVQCVSGKEAINQARNSLHK
jgi:putative addiction module component (TIGR02574 family)